MANMISGILDADQENIKSQLEYAKALRTKGLDTQGQMIGPHYVAKNPWQNFIEAATGAGVERYQRDKQRGIESELENQRNAFLTSMPTSGDTRQVFDPVEQDFGPTQATVEQFVPKPTRQYAQQMREWATRAPKGMEGIQGFALQQAMTAPEKQAALEQQAKDREAQLLIKAAEERQRQRERLEAQAERDRQRAQDKKDQMAFAASLRPGPSELDIALKEARLAALKNPPAAAKLSPTEQKELFEADEMAIASKNSIGLLNEAKGYSDKAYSGYFALPRAQAKSVVGGSEAADATIQLNNILTGQGLESLKATFGAAPTEGERKILLEMQASADKTPKQRKEIIDRAVAAAERRIKFNEDKAKAIRDRTYFSPSGQQSASPVVPIIDFGALK